MRYPARPLQDVYDFILVHLDEPLTIDSLGRRAGLNADKLKKGFKEVYGTTLHRFIVGERLKKAEALLRDTDKALKEVAALTGYSERNFYAFFKRHRGLTPALFRAEARSRDSGPF